MKKYELPSLPYAYAALEPHMFSNGGSNHPHMFSNGG
jgi:superoxide dismutase